MAEPVASLAICGAAPLPSAPEVETIAGEMHEITTLEPGDAPAGSGDTIGGRPLLTPEQDIPSCGICGQTMVFFMQFELRPEYGLPFAAGSRLLAFMCPIHNEVSSLSYGQTTGQLPDRYWEDDGMKHLAVFLYPPGPVLAGRPDPQIAPQGLQFAEADEEVNTDGGFPAGIERFKVGGTPGWLQHPYSLTCQCGADTAFIGQLPDDYLFPKIEAAPSQPDSPSRDAYVYCLGCATYFFGCTKQCNARAVAIFNDT